MPHATAKVNGTVIADADSYEVVEGNIYVFLPLPCSLTQLLPFPPLTQRPVLILTVSTLVSQPLNHRNHSIDQSINS
jgi:hypothetical protein